MQAREGAGPDHREGVPLVLESVIKEGTIETSRARVFMLDKVAGGRAGEKDIPQKTDQEGEREC